MERGNHHINSERDFTKVSRSFEGKWRDGIRKEELEELIADFLISLFDFIEDQTESRFMGHIKGILRADSGRMRFNLVSKRCGIGIQTDISDKIYGADAGVVVVFYDPDFTISKDRIRAEMKDLWENIFSV